MVWAGVCGGGDWVRSTCPHLVVRGPCVIPGGVGGEALLPSPAVMTWTRCGLGRVCDSDGCGWTGCGSGRMWVDRMWLGTGVGTQGVARDGCVEALDSRS